MTTLSTIIQDALRGYHQRQLVTGTVASYNTTMLQDSARQEPQGEFDRVDSWLYVTSGAASGSEARVMGFSAGNQSVLFAPSIPSLSATTNYRIAKTFSRADAVLAVNSALRDMNPERIIQSFATAMIAADTLSISVPSQASNAIADLIKVDHSWGTTNSPSDWRELVEGPDYEVDLIADGTRTLRLAQTQASGNIFRFHYRRPAAELTADSDTTDEPLSLILAGTRKWLAIQDGDQQAIERFGREFENAKSDYLKSRANTTIKFPRVGVVGYWPW